MFCVVMAASCRWVCLNLSMAQKGKWSNVGGITGSRENSGFLRVREYCDKKFREC